MTSIRRPSVMNWPVFPGDIHGCANFLRQDFWKLSSDRQTDTTEIIMPLNEWSMMVYVKRENVLDQEFLTFVTPPDCAWFYTVFTVLQIINHTRLCVILHRLHSTPNNQPHQTVRDFTPSSQYSK